MNENKTATTNPLAWPTSSKKGCCVLCVQLINEYNQYKSVHFSQTPRFILPNACSDCRHCDFRWSTGPCQETIRDTLRSKRVCETLCSVPPRGPKLWSWLHLSGDFGIVVPPRRAKWSKCRDTLDKNESLDQRRPSVVFPLPFLHLQLGDQLHLACSFSIMHG